MCQNNSFNKKYKSFIISAYNKHELFEHFVHRLVKYENSRIVYNPKVELLLQIEEESLKTV